MTLTTIEKQAIILIFLALDFTTCGRSDGVKTKNKGGVKYKAEPTPRKSGKCQAEEASNRTAEYHRRREVNLRLLNRITSDGVPEDWDGTFPSGPTEDYKHLVETGHKVQKESVLFPKLIENEPRCPRNHSKSYCVLFKSIPFPEKTVFQNVEIRIAQKVLRDRRSRGRHTFWGGRRVNPHIIIQLLDERLATLKTMTSYFVGRARSGTITIALKDIKDLIKVSEKSKRMKIFHAYLKFTCVGCFFEQKKKDFSLGLPHIWYQKHNHVLEKVVKDCGPGYKGCCLENHWQEFKESYIGYPKRYNMGRCRGSCDEHHDLDRKTISERIIKNHEEGNYVHLLSAILNKKDSKKAKLCCVPKSYGKLPVLYMTKQSLTMKIVENVVITECGCA
eukprot:TCONS_00061469-protein